MMATRRERRRTTASAGIGEEERRDATGTTGVLIVSSQCVIYNIYEFGGDDIPMEMAWGGSSLADINMAMMFSAYRYPRGGGRGGGGGGINLYKLWKREGRSSAPSFAPGRPWVRGASTPPPPREWMMHVLHCYLGRHMVGGDHNMRRQSLDLGSWGGKCVAPVALSRVVGKREGKRNNWLLVGASHTNIFFGSIPLSSP
jgi:hypothetical protein